MPIVTLQLCYFIAFLSFSGLSVTTATTYLAGIAFKQQMAGLPDPLDSFVVKKMMAGFRRANSKSHDQRLPITEDILQKILVAIPSISASTFESILIHAAFTLAFFGFLRIGEISANSRFDIQPSVLRRSDVKFSTRGSQHVIIIDFRVSKNNQFGSPQTVVVPSHTNPLLCPVLALRNYLLQADAAPTLFAHFDKSPITRYQFSDILKKAISFTDIPGKHLFKSHSFRIGAATTAHMHGLSDEEIQVMGRWRSNAFKTYIRLSPQGTQA